MNIKICLTFATSWLLLAYIVNSQDTTFDVSTYGAKPDGSDIATALADAWKAACASTTPSIVLLPKGEFALSQAEFKEKCKAPINLKVEGTLKAPSDPTKTDYGTWITFMYIDQLTISGGGIFDGQGEEAWKKNDCNVNTKCPKLPYNLAFNFVTNSAIQDVTSSNSKNFHVMVFSCTNVTFDHFTISAPGDSPNTDGIHIAKSKGVSVTDSTIKTGDDCISIGDGTEDLHITGLTCGPGHGVGVGSLGKTPGEEPVRGVFVKNCTFIDSQNGIRIKTWPGFNHEGLVTDVHAEDIIVQNVGNPVVIDQRYCPWNQCDLKSASFVHISKSSFKNIKGTASSTEAIKLDCSNQFPCEEIEIGDVDISYTGNQGPIKITCSNVKPTSTGVQKPELCTAPALPFGAKAR